MAGQTSIQPPHDAGRSRSREQHQNDVQHFGEQRHDEAHPCGPPPSKSESTSSRAPKANRIAHSPILAAGRLQDEMPSSDFRWRSRAFRPPGEANPRWRNGRR